jgi:putative tricarboxylic transport membrane protein
MYIANIMLLILNAWWALGEPLSVCPTRSDAAHCDYLRHGVFTTDNNIFDMWVMFVFGIIGYLMRKLKFLAAFVVLALVLGPLVERTLRQSLTISHGDVTIFFTRPISAVLIIIALVSLCAPLLRGVMDWRKKVVEIS